MLLLTEHIPSPNSPTIPSQSQPQQLQHWLLQALLEQLWQLLEQSRLSQQLQPLLVLLQPQQLLSPLGLLLPNSAQQKSPPRSAGGFFLLN